MTLVQFSCLVGVLAIIFMFYACVREVWNGFRRWKHKRNEEEKAVRKLITYILKNPNDEAFLNKNFSLYGQKTIVKNETVYSLKIYEDLFQLYWLVYVYRNLDDSLMAVKYCSKSSEESKKLIALLEV